MKHFVLVRLPPTRPSPHLLTSVFVVCLPQLATEREKLAAMKKRLNISGAEVSPLVLVNTAGHPLSWPVVVTRETRNPLVFNGIASSIGPLLETTTSPVNLGPPPPPLLTPLCTKLPHLICSLWCRVEIRNLANYISAALSPPPVGQCD